MVHQGESEPLHQWDVAPKEAVQIQRELARRVRKSGVVRARFVAGLDCAFDKAGQRCFGAAVVWDMKRESICEQASVVMPLTFPYVPGLLTFREGPTLLKLLHLLKKDPDAVMCDGHGIAHPRRLGIASHIGLWVGLPTIGCAKSRLCGTHDSPGENRGDRSALWDGDERIGTVLRTRDGVKPLFVSIGTRIGLANAERLVLNCGAGYRLPEPTRLADQLVATVKKTTMQEQE